MQQFFSITLVINFLVLLEHLDNVVVSFLSSNRDSLSPLWWLKALSQPYAIRTDRPTASTCVKFTSLMGTALAECFFISVFQQSLQARWNIYAVVWWKHFDSIVITVVLSNPGWKAPIIVSGTIWICTIRWECFHSLGQVVQAGQLQLRTVFFVTPVKFTLLFSTALTESFFISIFQ